MAATTSNNKGTTKARAPKPPEDHKVKTAFGQRMLFPLTVPSGSEIKVIRPGVQGLIKAGLIEGLDSLAAIVETETVPRAEGKKVKVDKESIQKLLKDPSKVQAMTEMMDKIVMFVVADPKLREPVVTKEMVIDKNNSYTEDDLGKALSDEERDPELAYIDYVSDDDKTFIMNFALGGSADLQQFRKATQEALGDVADQPEAGSAS